MKANPWQRSARARSWGVDALQATPYLLASVAIALAIADGALLTVTPVDYIYALGRAAGLVAGVLMMCQVALAARIPLIDAAIGHDRAIATHARWGKVAILTMLAHAAIVTLMSAHYADLAWWDETTALFTSAWYLAGAQVALGLFTVVFVTALVIVRRRWRYETWHAVHLITYLAVALAVPHQVLEGSTFRDSPAARVYWLTLYVAVFAALITYRVVRPIVRWRRYGLRVAAVTTTASAHDDHPRYTQVRVTGTEVKRLGVRPGQFLLWRFMDRAHWRSSHPFTVSHVEADHLGLTAKVTGDGTAALGSLQVGTPVLVEGPFGVFTRASRTQPGAVLIAAGVGITPVRALLTDWNDADGPVDVIVRVRSRAQAPLLDDVSDVAAARAIPLTVVEGPRGRGWASATQPLHLAELVTDIAARDLYICGPAAWTRHVVADARAAGVPAHQIHRESFGWQRDGQ